METLDTEIGYNRSLDLLRQSATPNGFVASLSDTTNYRRVWARDGVICGLAALLSSDNNLKDIFKVTLEILGENQGPQGQIPSNIELDDKGKVTNISYGSLAGRVDTIPWFIIGVCNYGLFTSDLTFVGRWDNVIKHGFDLLKTWEFNNKNLIYVPQSGDWADNFIFHGYILYDQLLRLWALRVYGKITGDKNIMAEINNISEILKINYWLENSKRNSRFVYHKKAFDTFLDEFGDCEYALPALTPGGYFNQFDALSNALSILLGLLSEKQTKSVLSFGQKIISKTPGNLMPIFWPPVTEEQAWYQVLSSNFSYEFKNKPHHYQNGGMWPMVNGWWGSALCNAGWESEARELLQNIHHFNQKKEWGFYEYGDSKEGNPHGTSQMAFSASGAVILNQNLNIIKLNFG